MASDNELQIVLKLVDEASGKLKEITAGVKKDTQDIAKESDKASKSIKDGFKDAGKELKDFRRALYAVTAEITAIIMVTKEWAKHNVTTAKGYDNLQYSLKELTALVGSIFAPAIISLSNLLRENLGWIRTLFSWIQEGYTSLFEAVSYILQLHVSFMAAIREGVSISEAWAIANRDASRAASEMGDKFKMAFQDNLPAVEGMNWNMEQLLNLERLLTDATYQRNFAMQEGVATAQEFAKVKAELANQDIMNDRKTLDSATNLLKTLESMHKTVWGGIYDFMNMGLQAFSSGMTKALTAIIMQTKGAREAWTEFGMSMITAIVEFVIQWGIQALMAMALGAMVTAAVVAQATTIAAAWLPAAIFASIATMGGADVAGAVGMAAASASGLAIGAATMVAAKAIDLGTISVSKGKAEGGWVGLHGPETVLVGERGPEYVVPNHQLGGGRQTTVHIEINNPVLSSKDDIDYLTEEISQRLAREAERL